MSEKKVIVIDDDSRNIFALTATLRAKGYACHSFHDAREAIHALQVKNKKKQLRSI
jgi:DNA-binding NtrC family response regulator